MVQNLPSNISKESLTQFFEEKSNGKVVNINLCYEISEYQEAFHKKIESLHLVKELEEKYHSQQDTSEKAKIKGKLDRLKAHIAQQELLLDEY